MTDSRDDIATFSESDIVSWVSRHPDFLNRHPELLHILTPPEYKKTGDNVVDMQQFMVDRLRQDIEELQSCFGEIIFSARENLSAQAQMHDAVLHLLQSNSLEELVHVVTEDLHALFHVDVVTLCMEADVIAADGKVPDSHPYAGVRFIPTGTVARLFSTQSIWLGESPLEREILFGEGAGLARSTALVPLELGPRLGILAFGVRDRNRFHPDQGTELLEFLGKIVALCVRRMTAI